MARQLGITAIKLKKDIWFLKAGTVYFYKEGMLWVHEPNNEPVRTLDSLAEAIMGHIEPPSKNYPDDDEYIEILETYRPKPAQFITDYEGNKYKLVES